MKRVHKSYSVLVVLLLLTFLMVINVQGSNPITVGMQVSQPLIANLTKNEKASQVTGSLLQGETDWTNMDPATAPLPRVNSPLVYVSQSDRVILFSGWTNNSERADLFYNDTWTYHFNTNTWTNMSPSTLPPGRGGHVLAYDVESDRVILFGGARSGWGPTLVTRQEIWAYDLSTNNWTNMAPPVMPSGRVEASFAYDSESDRIILFGGYLDGGIYNAETWTYHYNTNTWTNMNPTTHPSPRQQAPMAYDVESDQVIIMGGWHDQEFFDETWAYDFNHNTWTQMSPSPHPQTASTGLSYDGESDRVISFGGAIDRAGDELTSDTWAYDFNTDTWTNMNSAIHPAARYRAYMTYDAESDRTILFGGFSTGGPSTAFDDTWAYDYQPNPPSAPLNLQATSGTATITLNWDVPFTDAGSPITGYTVYRGAISGDLSLFVELGDVKTYSDTNVTAGITYYYVVRAVNGIGEGDASDEVDAMIPLPFPFLLILIGGGVVALVLVIAVIVYLKKRG